MTPPPVVAPAPGVLTPPVAVPPLPPVGTTADPGMPKISVMLGGTTDPPLLVPVPVCVEVVPVPVAGTVTKYNIRGKEH